MESTIYETGEYLAHNESWHTEDSPWKARDILRILRKNLIEFDTVCEVGCGAGEILRQMSYKLPKTTQFHGYEISPQAYEMTHERASDRLHFYLKDLLEEDPSVTYDVVMAIDVFEHVEDDFGFVRQLRPRGTYQVYHIPLDISVNGILQDKFMYGRKTVGHIHYYTKETALALLQDTGHQIIDYFLHARFAGASPKNDEEQTGQVSPKTTVQHQARPDREALRRIFTAGAHPLVC